MTMPRGAVILLATVMAFASAASCETEIWVYKMLVFFWQSCTLVNNEDYGSKLDNAIHTTVIELLSLEQFCVCSEKWVTWCAGDRLQQMEEEEERMASGAILHLSTPLVEGAELFGSDWRESDSSKNIYTILLSMCYDKWE